MSSVVCLEISTLRRDGGLHCRIGLNQDSVAIYAAALKGGTPFPPVIAFNNGQEIWLADGYHRIAAAESIGHKTCSVDLRSGSLRDAILYVTSIKASKIQGIPHTLDDRSRVVERLLRDYVWSRCSDDQIADHCGVSRRWVHRVRQEFILRN